MATTSTWFTKKRESKLTGIRGMLIFKQTYFSIMSKSNFFSKSHDEQGRFALLNPNSLHSSDVRSAEIVENCGR